MQRAPTLTALALACFGCGSSAPIPAPPSAPAASSASAGAQPSLAASQEKLPPEEIQRVLRESSARFRDCYEKGLRNNPTLEGRVSVSFVIELDGSTSSIENKSSDIPDPNVVRCVLSGFANLRFPSPKGGTVKFTYPIVFSPGGDEPTTPAPPGYFAGCFMRESPGGDVGKLSLECDQKVVTVVDLAAKLGKPMAKRELSVFEGQFPPAAPRAQTTPTLSGKACFMTIVDLPRGPVGMVLAPIGPHETRRVICAERGIPGKSSPWCARAFEILAQSGAVVDLLRTP